MSRIRLLMSVEGQTEQAFVRAAIAPHLAGHGVDASARLLFTNRKLGGRGGVMRYPQVRRDLERLFPFIQLHEFEALLFCDLTQLAQRIDRSDYGIRALEQEVAGLQPEYINDGEATAPSKRIIRHVPIYERSKPRLGATAAAAIGLPAIRRGCPHFNAWITLLEGLP